MPAELVVTACLVAVVFWLDVKATVLVVRDTLSEPSQRFIQLLMVWLLPVIGAIIVFAVHRSTEKHSGKYREPPDPGDDFGFPRYGGRSRSADDGGDD